MQKLRLLRQQFTSRKLSKWLPWMVAAALVAITAALWPPIAALVSAGDAAELEVEVQRLGAWAPLAYLALSVIQIVGAPIPGYPVQFLGGVLFGAVVGGLYALVGMVAGGLVAAWLARTLGRPFIERRVASDALQRYEKMARLESLWVWVLILLTPVGDVPYYIAGLSRVKFSTLAAAIVLSRGPFTFLITWAGATSVQAPLWVIVAMMAAILALVALGYIYKDALATWFDRHLWHWLEP